MFEKEFNDKVTEGLPNVLLPDVEEMAEVIDSLKVKGLNEREQKVVIKFYYGRWTQSELAKSLKVSRSMVQKILDNARRKLDVPRET